MACVYHVKWHSSNSKKNKSLNIFKGCQVEETYDHLLSYHPPPQVFREKFLCALNVCYLVSKSHPACSPSPARLQPPCFHIIWSLYAQIRPEI